jgi:hypothetical protein
MLTGATTASVKRANPVGYKMQSLYTLGHFTLRIQAFWDVIKQDAVHNANCTEHLHILKIGAEHTSSHTDHLYVTKTGAEYTANHTEH